MEISEFATNILHHGRFSSYPGGTDYPSWGSVKVSEVTDTALLMKKMQPRSAKTGRRKALTPLQWYAGTGKRRLRRPEKVEKYIPIVESDLEKAEFSSGIMVLPVEYTKGLEFDAVLILDPTRGGEYPVDDGHAKLLYVAATRALHELCVLHQGNLTGLIADPLPADAARKTAEGTCLNKQGRRLACSRKIC